MTETPYLERSIVPLIDTQFPLFYRERYPQFVAFYKAYHAWLESESGKAAYVRLTRDFLDLRDVDRTTQDFLIFLKQKYVRDLKLDTLSDTRQLIKHAKDLYRAKGTPRALDLFFRLLFDEVISIYYPKDDIFVLSSGKWVKPRYLELSLTPDARPLEGKQVVGVTSGATAFIDSVVKRTFNDRRSVTAYMSAIEGAFQTGEIIIPTDGSIDLRACPTIVGSLTSLVFGTSGAGAGYSVGDIVPINSSYGVLGLARVSNTVTQTGLIELDLVDGGYGYTNNTVLNVSDVIVNLSNVTFSNGYAQKYFQPYDTVTQPLATYHYNNANGSFVPGDAIRAYTNNAVTGLGTVLSVTSTNTTSGSLVLSVLSGNLAVNAIYTTGNVVGANLYTTGGGYVDATATGWVVGTANLVLSIGTSTGSFVTGEDVIQHNPLFPSDGAVLGSGTIVSIGSSIISLDKKTGVFRPGKIIGRTSGAVANVTAVQVTTGIKVTNGTFSALSGNYVYAPSVNGTFTFVGSHISANFGISNTLLNTETVSVNKDYLADYANVHLDAASYGFPGNTAANASSFFSTYLSFENVVVGTIANVYTTTAGTQLDSSPMVIAVESRDQTLNDYDVTIYFANASAAFGIGEIVTQAAPSSRGVVKGVNSTALSIGNLRLDRSKSFVVTTNSTTRLVGSGSGSTANVIAVWANRDVPPVGRNANLTANTITSNGAVTEAEIIDSGFGYIRGETIWLGSNTDTVQSSNSATGIVTVETQGKSRGFYTSQGGFLSSNKKLFDGDFYQNFSYEISSSHQLDKYVDTLKKTVHVAGMKVFGRYVHVGVVSLPIKTSGATVRVS